MAPTVRYPIIFRRLPTKNDNNIKKKFWAAKFSGAGVDEKQKYNFNRPLFYP